MRRLISRIGLAIENGVSPLLPLKGCNATVQVLLYASVALVVRRKRALRLTAAMHFALLLPSLCMAANYNITDLGTLGGTYSQGFGINASGQVAGVSFTAAGYSHGFLYDGTMHDLGTLGGNESNAQGINSIGQVTGWASTNGDVINHAILYDMVHGMVDLNLLIPPLSGWELTNGIAINDAGQITGFGTLNGATHAFLLTPIVPEPATLSLAMVGSLALVVLWNRRLLRRASTMLSAPGQKLYHHRAQIQFPSFDHKGSIHEHHCPTICFLHGLDPGAPRGAGTIPVNNAGGQPLP
jgi:probable HAF family extracellular repeat protein